MIRDYQDLSMTFDPESEDPPRIKAPPKLPQSRTWVRRLFPTRRLILILLGLSFILTITVMVFGVKGHFYNAQLKETQDSLNSFSQTIGKQFMNLQDKVRTEACCPRSWNAFRKSCYWESREQKSWEEAKAECKNHDAHLQFVAVRVKPHFVWIGLTDADGSWKWVDGSPYTVVSRDWCPQQPDNWYDHGHGGREDCAHLYSNGCWNDAHCTRPYGFVCEMEMEI
ncbi:hypothetical protein Chor_013579 [Crotalus horridus]